jgi:hypothetical protein
MKNIRLILIVVSMVIVLGLAAYDLYNQTLGAAPVVNLTSVTSQAGVFRVSYTPTVDPLPLNHLHNRTVKIETADGKPVNFAEIAVTGGMPALEIGLPTQPQMTNTLGEGRFTIEGFRFHRAGAWVVTLLITTTTQMDIANFNIVIR